MPTLDIREPNHDSLTILVEGRPLAAVKGQTVASALLSAGVRTLRKSPSRGTARGAFCLMGACQECAILIDGAIVRACQVPVREGLVVALKGVPGSATGMDSGQ
ncbi:MAG: (2Fe-2S)-binding protein [Pseudomonadota bacterium]